jgi:ketosteroid isomerase-like protein
MSSKNVDLVKRQYAHYAETGDIFEPALDPAIEWHSRSDLPDSDTYRGIEAVRTFIQGWPSAFDNFSIEIEEIIDEGDHVAVSMILHARLKGSSEEVVMPETHVWKVREGKLIEGREYPTKEEALEVIAETGAGARQPSHADRPGA